MIFLPAIFLPRGDGRGGLSVKGCGGLNQGKSRASLMGIAAAYLLYLAYELLKGRADPNTTMAPIVRFGFIALFVIAAAAIGYYAFTLWRKSGNTREAPHKDDEDGIK